jgi:hypothetical protein
VDAKKGKGAKYKRQREKEKTRNPAMPTTARFCTTFLNIFYAHLLRMTEN